MISYHGKEYPGVSFHPNQVERLQQRFECCTHLAWLLHDWFPEDKSGAGTRSIDGGFSRCLDSLQAWAEPGVSVILSLDFAPFSFCFEVLETERKRTLVYGGFIFHQTARQWSLHT